MHYARWREHGDPGEAKERKKGPQPFGSGCGVTGCQRKHLAKGLCSMHYDRSRKDGVLGSAEPLRTPQKSCGYVGCSEPHYGKGWCSYHYVRWSKTGKPAPPEVVEYPLPWGEWVPHRQGYVIRYRQISSRKRQGQMQHRYVMEQLLGRPLLREETVHHVNGVRSDNRLRNLELWSSSHPSGQRVKDKVAWAREIIALYDGLDAVS